MCGARYSSLCCWVSSACLDVVFPWPSLATSDVPAYRETSRIMVANGAARRWPLLALSCDAGSIRRSLPRFDEVLPFIGFADRGVCSSYSSCAACARVCRVYRPARGARRKVSLGRGYSSSAAVVVVLAAVAGRVVGIRVDGWLWAMGRAATVQGSSTPPWQWQQNAPRPARKPIACAATRSSARGGP